MNLLRKLVLALAVAASAIVLLTACGADDGDPATWSFGPGSTPAKDASIGPSTREFTAYVTRSGCSGGYTGKPRAPKVEASKDKVVVTFTVNSIDDGDHTCLSNASVPAKVVLPEPLGDRELVDGGCIGTQGGPTAYCTERAGTGIRYSPASR